MRQSHRDWIAVDLDGDQQLPTAAPESEAQHALRRAWGRLPLWLRVSLLAGLCLTVAVPATSWVRSERRAARLAATDGLASDLTLPVHDAWRSYGTYVGAAERSGVLVSYDGESRRLRALDPDSGAVLWTSATITADATCRFPTTDPTPTRPTDGAELLLCADGARLDVVDVSDGMLVSTVALPWTEVDARVLGTDVVAVGLDEDGHIAAARWDASTAEERWSYTGDTVADGDRPLAYLEPEVVEVVTPTTVVHLDTATGARLPGSGSVVTSRAALPGGAEAVEESETSWPGARTKRVRVLEADGSERFVTDGYLAQPTADDGTAADVLLVAPQGAAELRAIDARSGEELWSTDRAAEPQALVDRRLLLRSDEWLAVVDARSGEELWRTEPSVVGAWPSIVTDGEIVARVEVVALSSVPEYADDVRPGTEYQMVARRLATGEVVWTAPWSMVTANALVVTPTGHVLAVGPVVLAGLQPRSPEDS
ncbi:MAG: PQQ-binding-like beta-propeller repeat protein [Actinomycetales bacterium]|nr:PQQ-binding-like beta-propeller repeat protein [Actinomycetales bacterium]